jgi:NADPH:quinone reductase-like Zn-dependent oxidoreductase
MRAVEIPGYIGANLSAITVVAKEKPMSLRPEDVLVRVHGSSVNPVDWDIAESPIFPGCPASFPAVIGMDVAGEVEAVGSACKRLSPGDKVWADMGLHLGAYAEYVVAKEVNLGLAPTKLSLQAAATLPLVSMTSLAALKVAGAPWKGNSTVVVVLGASGGCGSAGVQMARAFGAAHIVGTTLSGAANNAFVRSLGVDEVIDDDKVDWGQHIGENSVDVVYDTVGVKGSADKAMTVLRAGGAFVTIAGDLAKTPKSGVKQQFIHSW